MEMQMEMEMGMGGNKCTTKGAGEVAEYHRFATVI